MKTTNKRKRIPGEQEPITSTRKWEKMIHAYFTEFQKLLRRHQENGDGLQTFDLTDAMAKRREQAILNTMPEIYKRYKAQEGAEQSLGEAWRDMNLPFESYAHLDQESHILYGAAVWILEQIRKREDWREVYRLLPRDDRMLNDLCLHDVWHADCEYDLVYSICVKGDVDDQDKTSTWIRSRPIWIKINE